MDETSAGSCFAYAVPCTGEQWVIATDEHQLPKRGRTPWHGYAYAIEYGDWIKIGHTGNLMSRIKTIKRYAANYSNVTIGRIAYTPENTNHKEIEHDLHLNYSALRFHGSELFSITLDEFIRSVPELTLLDESVEKCAMSDAFHESLIGFITNQS